MLRLLGRDAGAQSVLLQLLDWPDCAALHRTGRSWRVWLDRAPVAFDARLSDFASLARCRWLHRILTSLQLTYDEDADSEEQTDKADGSDADNRENSGAEAALRDPLRRLQHETMFNQFLANVHCFHRLQYLHVSLLAYIDQVVENSARRAFAALPKLEHLVLEAQSEACDAVLNGLLAHVHLLPSLSGIEINGKIGSVGDLDLSRLGQCPKLDCLCVSPESASGDGDVFTLSPQQWRDVAQCKSLTELECGVLSWIGPDDDIKHDDTQETRWIDENVGLILTAKQSAGAAASGVATMSPLLWDRLVLHTQIEELCANAWLVGMSAAQRSGLSCRSSLSSRVSPFIRTPRRPRARAIFTVDSSLPSSSTRCSSAPR